MIGGRVSRFILRFPAQALAWGVSACLGLGLAGVWILRGEIGNDFSVYWRTANSPIQWAYWEHWTYPFPYMPTMILWTEPLQLIDIWPAFLLFVGLSTWALVKAARPHLSRNEMLLLLASPPFTNGIMTGQISSLMAALMLWACGSKNRIWAGVLFGIVASIKPQLVIFAPMLMLLNRDWKAIAASAATFVLLVALSIANYGLGIWPIWFEALGNFRDTLNETLIIDVGATPASVAESWGLSPVPFIFLGISAGGWLVYKCRDLGPVETTAVIAASSLLAAPYALTYDLVALAPFLAVVIYRGSISAALALSGVGAPLPLLLSALGLARAAGREVSSPIILDDRGANHPCPAMIPAGDVA